MKTTPVSINNQAQSTPETPPKIIPCCSPKSKLICILTASVLVLLVGVGSFLLDKYSSKPKTQPTIQTSPTPVLPTTTPDLTANWITYKTIAGLEFKCPADIHVCDFQNNVYLEYGFKSLCQDMEGRKKSLLTQEELNVVIKDFKNRINNKFAEAELSIEYDGDRSKITFFNEIINEDKTNIFAWFKLAKGYYYIEIFGEDKDVSSLFVQILSTFKFLD